MFGSERRKNHAGIYHFKSRGSPVHAENGECDFGDVLLGRAAGRQSAEDITIFDSTGIGLQDLMTASALIEEAQAKGIGTKMQL